MSILLGIDLGTSGSKALAINEKGKVITSRTVQYPLHSPKPGWSEQDPADWWEAIVKSIQKILNDPKVEAEKIEGLALSGQMHGSVFLDGKNQVIRPPLLWNDTRTTNQCDEIREKVGEKKLYKLVGNPPLEGFTAPKILWLKENELQNYDKLETLLLPKDYINYRLTGRLSTEVSDAAGTLLFEVKNRKWSTEMIEALGLKETILPEVLESVEVVGEISEDVARLTGLPLDTKVIAGGADNACSAIGNGIIKEGLVSSSIGSSGVILAHTDRMKVDQKGRIHSFNHSVPNKWYLMGVMLSAGLSFKWFRDNFGRLEKVLEADLETSSYQLLNRQAGKVSPGSEGLIFLPYLSGERTPHKDARARGVFFGFSNAHTKGHFVRAVLEGVVFGLRDSLELIKDLGVVPEQIRITGGGAKSRLWSQIQADVFNQEVVTTVVDQGPAFGAALLAGVGAGVYSDLEEAVGQAVKLEQRIEPISENVEVYSRFYPVYRSLYKSLKSDFDRTYEIANQEERGEI